MASRSVGLTSHPAQSRSGCSSETVQALVAKAQGADLWWCHRCLFVAITVIECEGSRDTAMRCCRAATPSHADDGCCRFFERRNDPGEDDAAGRPDCLTATGASRVSLDGPMADSRSGLWCATNSIKISSRERYGPVVWSEEEGVKGGGCELSPYTVNLQTSKFKNPIRTRLLRLLLGKLEVPNFRLRLRSPSASRTLRSHPVSSSSQRSPGQPL